MTIRKTTLVLALAISAFSATHASAFLGEDRPPPRGLNGTSLSGVTDQAPVAKQESTFEVKAAVLADGSRVEFK